MTHRLIDTQGYITINWRIWFGPVKIINIFFGDGATWFWIYTVSKWVVVGTTCYQKLQNQVQWLQNAETSESESYKLCNLTSSKESSEMAPVS